VLAVAARGAGWLHTEGNRIVDDQNRPVQWNGINWFGFETSNYAPHGLWQASMDSFLDLMARNGFNLLRVPWCNEMLHTERRPNVSAEHANPALKGKQPIEVLDALIAGAGRRGMRVVLDRHRPDSNQQSELWYTPRVSEEQWITDWVLLARRYRHNPVVVGADLHNEPHGPATWGDGHPKTDWRLAAERCGNALLDVHPDWLIFVEGVEKFRGETYWWGGNLAGAREFPVRLKIPHRLVYSPHDYGPGVFGQPWFKAADFPANMPALWNKHWGYLHHERLAPIWLGEFGARNTDPAIARDGTARTEAQWINALVDFLGAHKMYWAFWCLNPNSGDTGGLLRDDWKTIHPEKLRLLQRLMQPGRATAIAAPPPVIESPPTATPVTPPSPTTGKGQRLAIVLDAGNVWQEGGRHCATFHLHITNAGADTLPLEKLEFDLPVTLKGNAWGGQLESDRGGHLVFINVGHHPNGLPSGEKFELGFNAAFDTSAAPTPRNFRLNGAPVAVEFSKAPENRSWTSVGFYNHSGLPLLVVPRTP